MSDQVFRNPGEEISVILPATHCKIWQCEEPIDTDGYCTAHYAEYMSGRRGNALTGPRPSCIHCEKPIHAKGLCKGHYNEVYNEARRLRREAARGNRAA